MVSKSTSHNKALLFLEALPTEYQLDNITLCLTSRCNYDCIYCYNKPAIECDFPKKKLFDVIDQALDECGTIHFSFTGGEPFLHPSILDAITRIRMKHRRVSVLTNGSLLNNDIIKILAKLGVENVGISIDSINPKIYQAMTRSKALPKNIISTLIDCKKMGIQVEANIVLLEGYNLDPAILNLLEKGLKDNGIDKVSISEATPAGRSSYLKNSIYKTHFQKSILKCLGEKTHQKHERAN